MVTASAGVQTDLSQVVHPSCRSICHSPEPQIATVCVSSPRPECLGHRSSKHKLVGGLTAYAYPPTALLHRVIQKIRQCKLPDHCNNPRLARDALVLGPSAALNRDPASATSLNNPFQTVPQLCFTAIHNISTSTPGVYEWTTPRTRLLCGGGGGNCCPSEVINKNHL